MVNGGIYDCGFLACLKARSIGVTAGNIGGIDIVGNTQFEAAFRRVGPYEIKHGVRAPAISAAGGIIIEIYKPRPNPRRSRQVRTKAMIYAQVNVMFPVIAILAEDTSSRETVGISRDGNFFIGGVICPPELVTEYADRLRLQHPASVEVKSVF